MRSGGEYYRVGAVVPQNYIFYDAGIRTGAPGQHQPSITGQHVGIVYLPRVDYFLIVEKGPVVRSLFTASPDGDEAGQQYP